MRGKGEGGLSRVPKDKNLPLKFWQGSFELPPAPDGTRRRKVVRAKDKKVLIEKMNTAKKTLQASGDMPTGSQTVESWFTYWLDNIAVKNVRPKTFSNYRSQVKNHVIPVIGKSRLDQVTSAHIRRVQKAIIDKGLSSTTAQSVHFIMSSAFASAYKDGRIPRNPTKQTDAPRRNTTELEVLSIEESLQLIETFRNSEQGYLWATFLLTGARRGELLGLEWDRVTDVIDLSWQLQRHRVDMVAPADYEYRHVYGGLYLTRPKSKSGTRMIPMFYPLGNLLENWRVTAPPNAHNLVFTTKEGRPIDPDYATHEWPKVLRAAGIKRNVRLHDLRHSAIDLLYEAGVDEDVIRETVGHSARAMTRAYKSRSTRKRLAAGLEPFAAKFSPPDEPDTRPAIGG